MAESYFGSSKMKGYITRKWIDTHSVQFIIGGWLRRPAVHTPYGRGRTWE